MISSRTIFITLFSKGIESSNKSNRFLWRLRSWWTGRALQVSCWFLYFWQILKPITLPWTSSRLQKKTCTVYRRLCIWIWNKSTSHLFLTKIRTRLYVNRRSLASNSRPVAVDCFIFIFSVLKGFPSNYFIQNFLLGWHQEDEIQIHTKWQFSLPSSKGVEEGQS